MLLGSMTVTMRDVIQGKYAPKHPQKTAWMGIFKPKRRNLCIAISPELLNKATIDLRTEFRPQNTLRGWSAITLKPTQHGWRTSSWKLIWRNFSAVIVRFGYRISSKSKHPLRKYDVISMSQDGGRDGILLPVLYLLMSLPSGGQHLLANQILSIYLKWRLRYNYFRFRNTNVRHIGATSDFDLDEFAVICMLFCIRLPNVVQIGEPTAEIWRHICFSRWRTRPLNTTSGFVFVDVTAFRRSKSISKPNFVEISLLAAEI